MEYNLSRGEGRHQVNLQAIDFGGDLLIHIFNENAHIGAVSVGEFDFVNERASVSVMTRLGHKDDSLAQKAAYLISKYTRKTVCVVAGVHLDNISQAEITILAENAGALVEELLNQFGFQL